MKISRHSVRPPKSEADLSQMVLSPELWANSVKVTELELNMWIILPLRKKKY